MAESLARCTPMGPSRPRARTRGIHIGLTCCFIKTIYSPHGGAPSLCISTQPSELSRFPSLHSSSLLLFVIKLEMTLDIRTTVMTGTPYHASTTCWGVARASEPTDAAHTAHKRWGSYAVWRLRRELLLAENGMYSQRSSPMLVLV